MHGMGGAETSFMFIMMHITSRLELGMRNAVWIEHVVALILSFLVREDYITHCDPEALKKSLPPRWWPLIMD
jgi:hypothetical protein